MPSIDANVCSTQDATRKVFATTTGDELAVRTLIDQTAGPLEVELTLGGGNVQNIYDESLSVASSTPTTVLTYTVPVGKTLKLTSIDVSGSNLAVYQVQIDSTVEDKKRTWWTKFNESFVFGNKTLSAGQVIDVIVEHTSSAVGDFNAKILGVLE